MDKIFSPSHCAAGIIHTCREVMRAACPRTLPLLVTSTVGIITQICFKEPASVRFLFVSLQNILLQNRVKKLSSLDKVQRICLIFWGDFSALKHISFDSETYPSILGASVVRQHLTSPAAVGDCTQQELSPPSETTKLYGGRRRQKGQYP